MFIIRGGFRGGAPGPPPLFLLVKLFRALYLPLYQHLLQNQFMYRSKMSIVCDFGLPLLKNSGSAPDHVRYSIIFLDILSPVFNLSLALSYSVGPH